MKESDRSKKQIREKFNPMRKQFTEKEVDPALPGHIVNNFTGEWADELDDLEVANEYRAKKEINEQRENN